MLIIIKQVIINYDRYRTRIIAERRRRWFEFWRIFTKPHQVQFIGKGTKWQTFPEYQPVPKSICTQLQQVEQRHSFIKRNSR